MSSHTANGENLDQESDSGPRRSTRVSRRPHRAGSFEDADDVRNDRDNDGETSAESEVESDHSEEEERSKPKRSRKRTRPVKSLGPAKRKRPNGSTFQMTIRTNNKDTAETIRQGGSVLSSAQTDPGLFGKLFASNEPLEEVAESWQNSLDGNEALAMTDFVNFVLKTCGCNIEVDEHDIRDPDNCTNRLSDIQDQFQANRVTEYPLVVKKTSTTVRKVLSAFLNNLVHGLATSGKLIDQPEVLANIQHWVSGLTSAASRPLRHTATLVSLEITSALCRVGSDMLDDRAKVLRQAEGERKNKKANKGRISGLEQTAKENDKRLEGIESLIMDWFDVVFIHRYRDVDPKIRIDCATFLGHWIVTYPKKFLESSYLRYLGWTLCDEVAASRHEVVIQLQNIYVDDSRLPALRQFTDRFRPRLVEMAIRDSDFAVRVSTVELLNIFRDKGLLEPDDIDNLGKLVFDPESRIRKAISNFLAVSVEELADLKIEELGDDALEEALSSSKKKSAGTLQREWLQLKSLVELIETYDPGQATHNRILSVPGVSVELLNAAGTEAPYLSAANALLDNMTILRDWQTSISYLLYEQSRTNSKRRSSTAHSQFEEMLKLSPKQEIILLSFLNASIRLDVEEMVEETSIQKKAKRPKKTTQTLKERRDEMTQSIANAIPQLLKKLGAQPEPTAAILQMALILNPENFPEIDFVHSTLAAMVDSIGRQFQAHNDPIIIQTATEIIRHLSRFENSSEVALEKLQALWEDSLHHFAVNCKEVDLLSPFSNSLEKTTGLQHAVMRLEKLSLSMDPSEWLEKAYILRSRQSGRKSGTEEIDTIGNLLNLVRRGASLQSEQSVKQNDGSAILAAETSLVEYCIQTLFFYFLWRCQYFLTSRDIQLASSSARAQNKTPMFQRLETYRENLLHIVQHIHGVMPIRVVAANAYLDTYSMISSLTASKELNDSTSRTNRTLNSSLTNVAFRDQKAIIRVFTALERSHAKYSRLTLELPSRENASEEDSDPESNEDNLEQAFESESEEAEQEETNTETDQQQIRLRRKQRATLLAEEKLCELTGRIIVALVAGAFGSVEGQNKVRSRLVRNRAHLGKNFKALIAKLVEAESMKTKGDGTKAPHASKVATQAATKRPHPTEDHDMRNSAGEEDHDESENEAMVEEDAEIALNEEDRAAEVRKETNEGIDDEPESIMGD